MKNLDIEKIKELMKSKDDPTFFATVPTILGISDSQVHTVSFIFWLCYMAETTMNDLIQEAWTKTQTVLSPATPIEKEIMKKMTGIDFDSLDQLHYFSDKVKVSQAVMGETDFVKMLWKLKNLRNDISHNRIDNLLYNDENLLNREVKEKILIDFIELSIKQGDEDPPEFKKLDEKQIEQIMTQMEEGE